MTTSQTEGSHQLKTIKVRATLEVWDTVLESLDRTSESIDLDLDTWSDDEERVAELEDLQMRVLHAHAVIEAKRSLFKD